MGDLKKAIGTFLHTSSIREGAIFEGISKHSLVEAEINDREDATYFPSFGTEGYNRNTWREGERERERQREREKQRDRERQRERETEMSKAEVSDRVAVPPYRMLPSI
jgi:hypothetical protein